MSLKYLFGNNEIDHYIANHSLRLSKAQTFLIEKTRQECRNSIMMYSPDSMHLLCNIARAIGIKKAIEVGVFTGYSTLSIASILPEGGKVLALDITNAYYDNFCKPAWEMAGVSSKIDFRLKPAVTSLEELISAGEAGTFDYINIDADKENYLKYYNLGVNLLRPGGFVAIDNVLWGGSVCNQTDQSPATKAIRELNDYVAVDDRVHVSMLRIGDGLTLAFKK